MQPFALMFYQLLHLKYICGLTWLQMKSGPGREFSSAFLKILSRTRNGADIDHESWTVFEKLEGFDDNASGQNLDHLLYSHFRC